jgi:hypothetical protein
MIPRQALVYLRVSHQNNACYGLKRTKNNKSIIGSRVRQNIADVCFPPMVGGGPLKIRFLHQMQLSFFGLGVASFNPQGTL